jgi:hypothetical protein
VLGGHSLCKLISTNKLKLILSSYDVVQGEFIVSKKGYRKLWMEVQRQNNSFSLKEVYFEEVSFPNSDFGFRNQ